MKIISLNTWGGRIHEPLLNFFEKHKDADIFCLQEIYHEARGKENDDEYQNDAHNLFIDIRNILNNHKGYFRPAVGDYYGLAIFVKNDIHVEQEGDISIYSVEEYKGGGNHSRNLQYIKLIDKESKLLVANVHGIWNGKGKTDTPERLEQSKRIKEFLNEMNSKTVLCGDFNLLPDTKSVKILEEDMENLVKEYGVSTTRSSYYTKPEKFADYIFVTSGIKVKDFKVLQDEVSDHLPLLVEF